MALPSPHDVRIAITLRGWQISEAILLGKKDIENRHVKLPTGWVAVHTGKGNADETVRNVMHHLVPQLPDESPTILGAVVGLCYVDRAVQFYDLRKQQGCSDLTCDLQSGIHSAACRLSPFAHGPWCNVLTAAIRLPKPIECPGGRNYWPLPEQVRGSILAQIASSTLRVENACAPCSWPLPWLPAGVPRMPTSLKNVTPVKGASFKRLFNGEQSNTKRSKVVDVEAVEACEIRDIMVAGMWTCNACTLLNERSCNRCKACDTSREIPTTFEAKPSQVSSRAIGYSEREGAFEPVSTFRNDASQTPTLQGAPGTIFSVGHSSKGFDHFVSLLTPHGIRVVVDVRSFPNSANEAFNDWARRDSLSPALVARDIRYEWHGALLGGKRDAAGDSLEERLSSKQGRDLLKALCDRARSGERIALMCAEENRSHCHRNVVAEHLVRAGVAVSHILHTPRGALSDHHVSPRQITLSKFFSCIPKKALTA